MRVGFLAAPVAIFIALAPAIRAQVVCKATIKVATNGDVTIYENGKPISGHDLQVPANCPGGFTLTFEPAVQGQVFLASFLRAPDPSHSYTPCNGDLYDFSNFNNVCVISNVINKTGTCPGSSLPCFKYTAVGMQGHLDPKVIVNTGTLGKKPVKKHKH